MQRRIPKITLGLAALSALVLTGCSANGGSGAGQKAELSFLATVSPNVPAKFWQAQIDKFEKAHSDVKVKLIVPPSAGVQQYAMQLAGTGQLPDVMAGIDPTSFIKAGQLLSYRKSDLTDFLEPMAGAVKGKQYKLPMSAQSHYVYYRKSLFAKAGISTPPTDWADFMADSAKLKSAGILPVQMGGSDADALFAIPMNDIITAQVIAKDKNFIPDLSAGKAKFTDPVFIRALTQYQKLVKDGYVSADATGLTYQQAQTAFLDGKGAMYPMGNWFAAAADSSTASDDFGIFSMPTPDGTPYVNQDVAGGGNVVSAATKYPDQAREFAVFMNTDQDSLAANVKADGIYPEVKHFTPPAGLGTNFLEGLKMSDNVKKHVPGFSTSTGDQTVSAAALAVINSQSKALFTGQKTPRQAAEAMDAAWSK